MAGRLVLLTTSHRVASGLLSGEAWATLRSADLVAAHTGHPLLPALSGAGVAVLVVPTEDGVLDQLLDEARTRLVVWVAPHDEAADAVSPGDLAARLVRAGERGDTFPDVEVLVGSWDVPGSRVLDLVAVMDRLRSPGGCPWDAEQTHTSLLPYLLEEAYETVEAVESGDRSGLREELGDLLLQVVFHARVAQEHPDEPWSVDDVAAGIVDKLVHRHPHVFGDVDATTPEMVEANWEQLKKAEKGRASAVDGVPLGQPALALAAKLMSRADKNGVGVGVPLPEAVETAASPVSAEGVGELLLGVVALARRHGIDPEAALRESARGYAGAVRAREHEMSRDS